MKMLNAFFLKQARVLICLQWIWHTPVFFQLHLPASLSKTRLNFLHVLIFQLQCPILFWSEFKRLTEMFLTDVSPDEIILKIFTEIRNSIHSESTHFLMNNIYIFNFGNPSPCRNLSIVNPWLLRNCLIKGLSYFNLNTLSMLWIVFVVSSRREGLILFLAVSLMSRIVLVHKCP